MFRKLQSLSGKRPHLLPWTVALAALIFLSALASSLSSVETGSDIRISTVALPEVATIEMPEPESMTEVVPLESVEEPVQRVACEDPLLMVGPDHTLSPDYVPPDLTYLSAYGITARGAEDMLREEPAAQLALLLSAAAEDGVEILVASGYRSYWEQEGTYNWFKEAYGEEAGKLSVPPGQSEHQLGTAVDFASAAVDYELVPEFAQTRAGSWLAEHAAQYGFVLSYSEDGESSTGVSYEPWHYRYVGVENALEFEAAGGDPTSFYREGESHCYES